MTQEEMQVIRSMMEEVVDSKLKTSESHIGRMMVEKIDSLRQDMNAKFDAVNEQLADIKEDTEITRSATNSLVDWAEEIGAVTQVKFPYNKAK